MFTRFPWSWVLLKSWTLVLLVAAVAFTGIGAESLPAAPQRHFDDYAGVISATTAQELDRQLAQFERDTSSQVVVAVFPELPEGTVLEDYVVSLFAHWGIGRKESNNGVLLAVFVKDRALRIEVGYGLEGAIPDAIAKRIIDSEIVPAFRQGQFDEGLRRGVQAIMAAARGEYRGTGRTVAEERGGNRVNAPAWLILVFIAFWLLMALGMGRRRGTVIVYGPGGRRIYHDWPGRGGGFGGGGFGGGFGGGGFRGGGGFSGGGGASGRW